MASPVIGTVIDTQRTLDGLVATIDLSTAGLPYNPAPSGAGWRMSVIKPADEVKQEPVETLSYQRHDYLVVTGERLNEYIVQTVEALKAHDEHFDAIAFRGMSGALLAGAVAAEMGKTLLCVRKEGESSHACCRVEGVCRKAYVILDDFVCEGDTVRTIFDEISNVEDVWDKKCNLKCYGIYTYKHGLSDSAYRDIDRPVGLNLTNRKW